MDTWSLRILTGVADAGSFSAAAEDLAMTQPAVSRQIAALERRFGVPLFRRDRRGVVPTSAGATAISLARGVLSRVDALDAAVRAHAGIEGASLSVTAFASANSWLLPEAIQQFNAAHPTVPVTLGQVEPFGVLDAVRNGEVDLALLTDWQLVADPLAARHDPFATPLDPDDIDGVELRRLLDDELLIAVGPDHRLARRRTIPLIELAQERWVDGAPPDCLGPLHQIAAAIGGPPTIAFMCDDWQGKQALVLRGLGVTVIPRLALGSVHPDLIVRPASPALPRRRLYAATPAPPYRTPATTAFLATLDDVASSLVGSRSTRATATPG